MRVTAAIGLALLAGTAGCGGQPATQRAPSTPVRGSEWRAVVVNVLEDGMVSYPHSCAAAVVARAQLSAVPTTRAQIDAALNRYEHTVCRFAANAWDVRLGMTDRQVVAAVGAPVPWLSGPHCWVYKKNKPGTSVEGARYCFKNGRVAVAQTSVHS